MTKFSILIIALSFITGITSNPCHFSAKVRQTLSNEGFHRNISYGIEFNSNVDEERWLYEDCVVSLEQTLPSGAFANPDELKDFRRTHKLITIIKNRVNIELPAEVSQPTTVYLIGTVTQSTVSMWLPVHARYHRPIAGGGNTTIIIEPPNVHLRCPDQRLELCNKGVSRMTFLCNGSSKDKCSWMEVPYVALTDNLTWEIPVGNTEHLFMVATVTAAAIAVGCVVLLRALHEYIVRTRKKTT